MSYGVHLEGGLSYCYVLKRLVSGLVATIGFDDRVFVGGLRIEMSLVIAFKNFGKLVLRAQLRHGVHFEGGKSSCYGLEHPVIGLDDAMSKRLVTGNVCCHRETSTIFSQLNALGSLGTLSRSPPRLPFSPPTPSLQFAATYFAKF